MSRARIALLVIAQVALAVLLPAVHAARPNVLIVLVDDAGYGDFGCHGHPWLKTPHIDRLHAESVRLTDFHVAPMCSPTRGQLLTGCHGLRTGVTSVTAGRTFLRPEFVTAPQMFAAAGWRTGIFGKWHLGDNYPHRPMDKGFQEAVWTLGWGFTSAPEFSNTLFDGQIRRGEQTEKFPGYITDFCFDESIRWMRARHDAAEPFFCYLPLHAAHSPHIVPDKFVAPYVEKAAPKFFGMLANIDENMGRLEDFLKQSGLRENTIVLFMTDNGGTAGVKTFNAGLRGHKTEYYDGGHRVPCFLRWPAGNLRAASDVGALTQVQDILPTLLDFCAVPKPAGSELDGVSLAPLLRGQTDTLSDRTIVVQYGPGFGQVDTLGPKKFDCAVLRKQWRLVHGTELYDVRADRAQANDVAATHPEIVASLRQHYESWWTSVAPRLREFVPVSLGSSRENPVVLTSSDWQDTYADNANHIRKAAGGPRGGPWNVNIERAGTYEIVLSRWPFEFGETLSSDRSGAGKGLPIAAAKLAAAGAESLQQVKGDAKQAVFTVVLPAGPTQLQAWFQDATGQDPCGAYYARITRR